MYYFLLSKNFTKRFGQSFFGPFQWVKKFSVSLVLVKAKLLFWQEFLLTFGQRN